jgi:hypothetical protein
MLERVDYVMDLWDLPEALKERRNVSADVHE